MGKIKMIVILLLFCVFGCYSPRKVFPNMHIGTAEAVKIAKSTYRQELGLKPIFYRPFIIESENESAWVRDSVYVVRGAIKPGWEGWMGYVTVSRKNGRVISSLTDRIQHKAGNIGEKEAIKITKRTYKNKLKLRPDSYKPFVIESVSDSVWVVSGSIQPGRIGRIGYVRISKKDGRVLSFFMTK